MRSFEPFKKTVRWYRETYDRERRAVKEELDSLPDAANPQVRLQYAAKKIQGLEGDDTARGSMRRFIFVVSSLIHHSRHRGLSPTQITRLVNLAHAILEAEGIRPGSSRLAFAYGELHLALSQIQQKAGDHWSSAWEQQMCLYLSGQERPGGTGFQLLSLGIRADRLGHAQKAISYFEQALKSKLPESSEVRARLGLIRALRLAGLYEEWTNQLAAAQDLVEPNSAEDLELTWERACTTAQRTNDLRPMMGLVKRGKSHFRGVYLLEAYLWSKGHKDRSYDKQQLKVRYLARQKSLRIRQRGLLYEACMALEVCYDNNTPIVVRLRLLGEMLARSHEFLTIESQLLFWAASARWLARTRMYMMASMVLTEYGFLSLRQSDGKSRDVLGVVSDLVAKRWYTDDRHFIGAIAEELSLDKER